MARDCPSDKLTQALLTWAAGVSVSSVSTATCYLAAAKGWIAGAGVIGVPTAGPTISASGRFVTYTTSFPVVLFFPQRNAYIRIHNFLTFHF